MKTQVPVNKLDIFKVKAEMKSHSFKRRMYISRKTCDKFNNKINFFANNFKIF